MQFKLPVLSAILATSTLSLAATLPVRDAPVTWNDANLGPGLPVFHTVLFQLVDGISEPDRQSFCSGLISLKDKAISPSTHKPYILTASGGADNSPEGAEHGYNVGFVTQFASLSDRDYFVWTEPTHQAWKAEMRHLWVNVTVVDFSNDVY